MSVREELHSRRPVHRDTHGRSCCVGASVGLWSTRPRQRRQSHLRSCSRQRRGNPNPLVPLFDGRFGVVEVSCEHRSVSNVSRVWGFRQFDLKGLREETIRMFVEAWDAASVAMPTPFDRDCRIRTRDPRRGRGFASFVPTRLGGTVFIDREAARTEETTRTASALRRRITKAIVHERVHMYYETLSVEDKLAVAQRMATVMNPSWSAADLIAATSGRNDDPELREHLRVNGLAFDPANLTPLRRRVVGDLGDERGQAALSSFGEMLGYYAELVAERSEDLPVCGELRSWIDERFRAVPRVQLREAQVETRSETLGMPKALSRRRLAPMADAESPELVDAAWETLAAWSRGESVMAQPALVRAFAVGRLGARAVEADGWMDLARGRGPRARSLVVAIESATPEELSTLVSRLLDDVGAEYPRTPPGRDASAVPVRAGLETVSHFSPLLDVTATQARQAETVRRLAIVVANASTDDRLTDIGGFARQVGLTRQLELLAEINSDVDATAARYVLDAGDAAVVKDVANSMRRTLTGEQPDRVSSVGDVILHPSRVDFDVFRLRLREVQGTAVGLRDASGQARSQDPRTRQVETPPSPIDGAAHVDGRRRVVPSPGANWPTSSRRTHVGRLEPSPSPSAAGGPVAPSVLGRVSSGMGTDREGDASRGVIPDSGGRADVDPSIDSPPAADGVPPAGFDLQ